MFKWLIKRKTNELIKLVTQNNMVLSQIIDMQQLEGAKPLNADFAKWVENRFLINYASLHRFKKSGSIKDQQIVKSL